MNENISSKRREWVKNAAIIFLSLMLVLTFFSNTIMNYSLPEVATQYVQSGTITAKVRGTGNVEATDPYNVMIKESRVISSVAVKQGDEVEKDQVLYYLEDKESEELKKAQDELEDLELAYMKGLFGGTVSADIISKVASGNTDTFSSYKARVVDMQNRIKAAEERVRECQNNVDSLTLDHTIKGNQATLSTIMDELEKDLATTDLEKAQAAFEAYKAERVAELNVEIADLQSEVQDLQTLVDHAQTLSGITGTSSTSTGSTAGTTGTTSSATTTEGFQTQKERLLTALKEKLKQINTAIGGGYAGTIDAAGDISSLDTIFSYLQTAVSAAGKDGDYQALYADYNAVRIQYLSLQENAGDVNSYTDNRTRLEGKKEYLEQLQRKLTEVQAITAESSGSIQEAKNRLTQATRNITEITAANTQADVARKNKIENANAALKAAQEVLELLKTEQTLLAADINAELDLSKTSKDIEEKKEEIKKLEEKSAGSAITAPVAGTVTSLSYVAGETTKPEETAAVLQVKGKGFTVSFSVTNEQAKKVKVGDMAEFQNAWYYDDAMATLSAIKSDPESQGQKKLLVFDVSGSNLEQGQSVSLSVGQRSAQYELVVPNSAIREDNNGKFILIVESKSGPISNRYIATRVDVEVLASDDNNTAISAGLYGYEYVITTSTKPVEAGKQVRLHEG